MANNNQIELVVTVEVDKANQSIKSVNANLSGIEAAATKSAHAASQGIDGMTASMVKGATAGNLIADAIKGAIDSAKEWTIEAAKMAAHESRMEASGRALAKSHGIAAQAFEESVEAVKKLGYHGEDAVHTIDRLIIADLDLSKAKGLAQIAKDAAAIENIAAPEALEKILQSIEFGNARGLRAAGLRVQFDRDIQMEELKLGRTLSENEQVQVRYNAVVRAAAAIQGAHASTLGEAETQMASLGREVKELKEAVGSQFQDQFKALVGTFRDLVAWLKDNADLLAKFGQAALYVAGILTTYALAAKIMDLAKSIAALRLASLNPYALLAGGVLAAGAVVYSNWKGTKEQWGNRGKQMDDAALRESILSGKTSIADLRKQGYTDDQLRGIVTGRELLPGQGADFDYGKSKITVAGGGPTLEDLKLAAEMRKKQGEVERESHQAALAAGAKVPLGFAKEMAEMNAQIEKWTTYSDDKGLAHKIALTRDAWLNVLDQLQNRWTAFKQKFQLDNQKAIGDYLKGEEEANRKVMEFDAQLLQRRLQNDEEWAAKRLSHVDALYQLEEARAGYARDAQLRGVEGIDAQTVQQKVAVEQQKMLIEVDYLEKVHEVKMRLFDMDTSRMVLEEEANLKRLGYQAEVIAARIGELTQDRDAIRWGEQEGTDAAVKGAKESAAIKQGQIVRDEQRKMFDSLKQQAGGVFDALLQKSQSVWSAIGNSFKTAILTAIKDVVTSRVAAMLMGLFTGQKVTFAGGGSGGGGGLGGLLGIGSVPVFGGTGGGTFGTGGGGAFGSGPVNGNPMVLSAIGGLGGGGGVSALGGSGGGGLTSIAGKGGMLGGLGSLAGLKDFLGFGGGGVQYAPGMATTWGASTFGQKLSALGRSGAALLGGTVLAMDGLRRGGIAGLAETTAGGALIGYKFGGPEGAAIGAAIGAAAGIVRLFIKGAQEKARDKIKAMYGVDISDKGVLKQIVDMAKQTYGGDIDVAIRSPQVRDLIQLYAMSTGKPTRGMPATMQSLEMVQSGGSLYQSPGYSNGTALPGMGGLASIDRIGGGVAPSAGPLVIQLDGPATTSLLRGEAVQAIVQNPRVVSGAAMSAAKSNAGRRELTSLQMSPGLLTA